MQNQLVLHFYIELFSKRAEREQPKLPLQSDSIVAISFVQFYNIVFSEIEVKESVSIYLESHFSHSWSCMIHNAAHCPDNIKFCDLSRLWSIDRLAADFTEN